MIYSLEYDEKIWMEHLFHDFDATYRERTMTWLEKRFNLTADDCEDIIQDAYMEVYTKVRDGLYDKSRSSLYTYFLGICKNKANEVLRKNNRRPLLLDSNEVGEADMDTLRRNAERILELTQHDEQELRELVVEQVVKNLPSPCGELLWSFYRDALPLKTIATMFGYASEDSAKVTKHRCMERFRKYYEKAFDK